VLDVSNLDTAVVTRATLGPTGPMLRDAARALPNELRAVTSTRILASMSRDVTLYERLVLTTIVLQRELQRCHL
jgi:hypothetical protein